ncbi:hypothetical protein SD71_11225 [Cohnella kolymensis]|uniref:HicB-like antitoxin of toxin-antitoxin system domain-containing protein n=1 Tax=Cohnella kolymensis TaxID=1590652 RepID=A0ABR5A4G6_9BACL|nr:type II toxin-antitoxin system HicB family antitoxin [Cohnella kolymensis]KIL35936.1 hypothetical protein SD71_11225 [Cohnella kolymensis]
MMKDIIYLAIFTKYEDDEGRYGVHFPDIQFAATGGNDVPEAFRMATELLSSVLYHEYASGNELPKPTPINEVKFVPDPDDGPCEWFVSLVTTRFLANRYNEAVERVNCTLRSILKAAAQNAKLNFSMILQEGIKDALGIVENKRSESVMIKM